MESQLNEQIEQLTEFIRREAPSVHVLDTGDVFEGESANLAVYPPLSWTEQQCRELQRKIAEQAAESLINHGYLILTYVYKPEQQILSAKTQLQDAKRTVESAQKILSQAVDLGLLQSDLVLS